MHPCSFILFYTLSASSTYRERIHNIIDTLLFSDLAIINALFFDNSQSSVLIYLPILTVAIVGYVCILMLHSLRLSVLIVRGQNQNGEDDADVSGRNVL